MSEEILEVVETSTSYFEKTMDGIVITKKKKDSFVDLENAIENCEAHRQLAGNKPMPCMIVMDEMQNTSPEALEYYSLPEHAEYRSAEAFVVISLGVRLIVDHYMKNSKMPYPIQMFETEKEAFKWLRSVL
jgi:hypothetical protein